MASIVTPSAVFPLAITQSCWEYRGKAKNIANISG
jgi:hypothetical protein